MLGLSSIGKPTTESDEKRRNLSLRMRELLAGATPNLLSHTMPSKKINPDQEGNALKIDMGTIQMADALSDPLHHMYTPVPEKIILRTEKSPLGPPFPPNNRLDLSILQAADAMSEPMYHVELTTMKNQKNTGDVQEQSMSAPYHPYFNATLLPKIGMPALSSLLQRSPPTLSPRVLKNVAEKPTNNRTTIDKIILLEASNNDFCDAWGCHPYVLPRSSISPSRQVTAFRLPLHKATNSFWSSDLTGTDVEEPSKKRRRTNNHTEKMYRGTVAFAEVIFQASPLQLANYSSGHGVQTHTVDDSFMHYASPSVLPSVAPWTTGCELISLHGLYLEEQGTRSAAGSVFRRGNGSLSEPLANGLMDRS